MNTSARAFHVVRMLHPIQNLMRMPMEARMEAWKMRAEGEVEGMWEGVVPR